MTMKADQNRPVFLHSLFRAGSTYIYHAIKRSGQFHAYHEPFHEIVGMLPTSFDDIGRQTEQAKGGLRHNFLEGGYFEEYVHLLSQIQKTFRPEISFDLFFLRRGDISETLKSYVDCLIEGALMKPVLQCTRTIGRVQWFRENHGGSHIFLLRNPWDQWFSYKVDPYIRATPRIVYSVGELPEVLVDVMAACGISPLLGRTTFDKQIFADSNPITSEQDYTLFFGLWLYAYVVAQENCDKVLDMDEISHRKGAQKEAQASLRKIGLASVDLHDCKLHRTAFKRDEMRFYSSIEAQVIELFRQSEVFKEILRLPESYLEERRPIVFGLKSSSTTSATDLLEDASRLRGQLVHSAGETARIARSLNKTIVKRDGQVARLEAGLAEREVHLESLQGRLSDRDSQVRTLKARSQERDAHLESIQRRLSEREIRVQELQEQLDERGTQVRALQGQLGERELQLQALQGQLGEREQQVQALNAQLYEIKISRAWRAAMLLRQWGFLLPHGSWWARLARKTFSFFFFFSGDMRLIRNSGYFDREWYLTHNPDAAQAGVDPARHYLLFGGFEGRDPSQRFSSSWYVENYNDVREASVNPLVHYLRHGKKEGRMPRAHGHEEQVEAQALTAEVANRRKQAPSAQVPELDGQRLEGGTRKIPITSIPAYSSRTEQPLTVFTVASKNFTAVAMTLFDSVKENHPDADMYMFLGDGIDSGYDPRLLPFKIVLLDELDIPNVEEMAKRYSITEFNTAIKPYAFSYLFRKQGKDRVVYLDPDILIISPLREVVEEFARGAECLLTPHILEPAENVEVNDHDMLLFGIYNLGFLGLRNTPDVIRAVEWLGRRLERDGVIDLERGLFVDQKWADLFPAFISHTSILRHPGYNVAYWNLSQRKIELVDGKWLSNRQPLRFVHFSGHSFDDRYIFSRHAGTFNRDNIGDLRHLLDSYRRRVFENNHQEYSELPYSFNWSGESGVNLHTPKAAHQADGAEHAPLATNIPQTAVAGAEPITEHDPAWQHDAQKPYHPSRMQEPRWLATMLVARSIAGGWLPMTRMAIRTLRTGGLRALNHRIDFARAVAIQEKMRAATYAAAENPGYNDKSQSVTMMPLDFVAHPIPKVFVTDWSIPRPDQDAGSVTTFYFLKVLVELGYDVTFVPSDLVSRGEYSDAVARLGVNCLIEEDIGTLRKYLKRHGSDYSAFILFRAPIAAKHLASIRKFAPSAKVILEVVDLHYLREERSALIGGTEEAISAAQEAKKRELNIISGCDVVIVLSPYEKELLTQELPDADIRVMPLLFLDMHGQSRLAFDRRKDILFIGGFRHSPNVDAVVWFCNEIWPLVRRKLPEPHFLIVGSHPTAEVIGLGEIPGVRVLGHKKNIGPIFNSVRLSVVPLRYGAGIKGKVATSLGYGVPVVGTRTAFEGMELQENRHVMIGDSVSEFVNAVVRAYTDSQLWHKLSSEGFERAHELYSERAGRARIKGLMDSLKLKSTDFEFHRFRSLEEYRTHRHHTVEEYKRRELVELSQIRHDDDTFYVDGYCSVCSEPTMFQVGFTYSDKTAADGNPIPNWREHLNCVKCGFVTRHRLVLHLLKRLVRPQANEHIYITEQVTPLFRWLKSRYPRAAGSEFLGDLLPLGNYRNGVRNEDLTRLTFSDESFDLILSLDVLEHVSDHLTALAECYRCLAQGGTLVITAPFHVNKERNTIMAQMKLDGTIEHLVDPPEYHGNPLDPEKGSLCFRYFGWELIEQLKLAGFGDASLISAWSRDLAYLGSEQIVLVATKTA